MKTKCLLELDHHSSAVVLNPGYRIESPGGIKNADVLVPFQAFEHELLGIAILFFKINL